MEDRGEWERQAKEAALVHHAVLEESDPYFRLHLSYVFRNIVGSWNSVFGDDPTRTAKGQPTLKLSERVDHLFKKACKGRIRKTLLF